MTLPNDFLIILAAVFASATVGLTVALVNSLYRIASADKREKKWRELVKEVEYYSKYGDVQDIVSLSDKIQSLKKELGYE